MNITTSTSPAALTEARARNLSRNWPHSGPIKCSAWREPEPYVAPLRSTDPPADITVSLGVGENASKRLNDAQERDLLRVLADTGASILVDKGGSAEERERVERALLPGMRTHEGAFAPFAAQIATSQLFVGYDSAGGHVASACGVPLISIAKGFVSERMAARWRPEGTILNESELAQLPELARKVLNT